MQSSKPRLWFTILVGALLLPVLSWCASQLFDVLWWSDDADLFFIDFFDLEMESPLGEGASAAAAFFLIALLSHFLNFSSILLLARYSGESLVQSLTLQKGRLSVYMMPAFLAGTFIAAVLGGVMSAQLFQDQSGALSEQMRMLVGFVGQSNLNLLLLVAGVLPGLGEELFFRGYLQRRLLRRLPGWSAILISSVLFAAAHGDVVYAFTIFPIGLWFGIVAYYSESVWPGIFCHFFWNACVVLIHTISFPPDSMEAGPDPSSGEGLGLLWSLIVGSILLGLLALLTRTIKANRRSDGSGGNPLPV